jgi:hypothetical protein
MKHLTEYIIERGPAPKVDLYKKGIVILDTYHNDDNDIDILIEDFMKELEYVDKKYEGFIVTGSLGLWYGKKEIYPEYFADLTEAYNKTVDKCDDVIVKLIEGSLEVSGMHHDGTNTLYIRPLSKEGAEIFSLFVEGYEHKYFENIDDDKFYEKFLKDKKMILSFEKDF